MKTTFIMLILLFSTCLQASDWDVEFGGNIEGQFRRAKNSDAAKEAPLNQNWDEAEFAAVMGNFYSKIQFKESRLEANAFVRHAWSPLFEKNYIAPNVMNFPTKMVARDVFKMTYENYDSESERHAVFNKLFYEWDYEDNRFVFGRMFINYGNGEIFNPINPFNQPLGLSSIANFSQGNDGFKFSIFVNDNYTLNFYLLGDKAIDGYDGQINRTLWMHGEYRLNEKWTFDYVIGEDQKRHKAGGQVAHILGDGMLFTQVLYSTELTNRKPSEHLWDALLGYDRQMNSKWHIRVELGHQKSDELIAGAGAANFSNRFLPSESFGALAQTYELHPLLSASATLVHDFETKFGYGIAKLKFSLTQNIELEGFVFAPVYWKEDDMSISQRVLTTDLGASLRAFF